VEDQSEEGGAQKGNRRRPEKGKGSVGQNPWSFHRKISIETLAKKSISVLKSSSRWDVWKQQTGDNCTTFRLQQTTSYPNSI